MECDKLDAKSINTIVFKRVTANKNYNKNSKYFISKKLGKREIIK